MLNDLLETINKLKTFDWEGALKEIVTQNTAVIEDLQRDQMASGKDSQGNETLLDGSGYADITKAYKRMVGVGLGAVIDRVTGYQIGNLYSEINASVEGDQYNVKSDVPYFSELILRTGEQWMTLNETERKIFGEEITLPMIKEIFLNKTGLIIT